MDNQGSPIFDALADPTRREILLVLSEGELAVGEISNRIPHIGRTSVSTHLRVLRLAGLVNERREGRFRYYSVDPAPASEVVEFVGQVYRLALLDFKVKADRSGTAHSPRSARESSA